MIRIRFAVFAAIGEPPVDSWVLVAVILPFAASGLWGKQFGRELVASGAALWILPAAVLAGAGYAVYVCLEWLAGKAGLT